MEILIVTAVIGILVLVAIPGFSTALERSREAAFWQYRAYENAAPFCWSPLQAGSLSAGDTVPVLRYNSGSEAHTVRLARAELRSRPGGAGKTYLALPNRAADYIQYTAGCTLDQNAFPRTYVNARQWLDQALAALG